MRQTKNRLGNNDLVISTQGYKDCEIDGIGSGIARIREEWNFYTKKTEAISTLASGIAHQFNNALVGITGNIELLKLDFHENEKVDRYVEPMEASVQKMVNLTNQLLAYARGGKYQPETISMNKLVKDSLPLIQKAVDLDIFIETDLASDIPNVKADINQMQMILSAVMLNAAEATEGPGRIKLITKDVEVDQELVKAKADHKNRCFVCLMIEDEGRGMDQETKNRIFEPFFTTKFPGRGLGMAAVYGIVKNHHGWVTVDSELGKGTIVRIYLPAISNPIKLANSFR